MYCLRRLVAMGLCLVLPSAVLAGPGQAVLLDYLNQQVMLQPGESRHYLRRAQVNAELQHWNQAFSDLEQLDALGKNQAATLLRGDFYSRLKNWPEAQKELEKVLRVQPGNYRAVMLHANALQAQGEVRQALQGYRHLLELKPSAAPGIYRKVAQLEKQLNGLAAALTVLDRRMQTIGVIPQLQKVAIEMERQAGHFEAAIERMQTLSPHHRNTPFWQFEMADLQLQNKNRKRAQYHIRIAEGLLESRQKTKASGRLAEHIQTFKQRHTL